MGVSNGSSGCEAEPLVAVEDQIARGGQSNFRWAAQIDQRLEFPWLFVIQGQEQ